MLPIYLIFFFCGGGGTAWDYGDQHFYTAHCTYGSQHTKKEQDTLTRKHIATSGSRPFESGKKLSIKTFIFVWKSKRQFIYAKSRRSSCDHRNGESNFVYQHREQNMFIKTCSQASIYQSQEQNISISTPRIEHQFFNVEY